ncbi:MAG: nitrilase-related carbon-nitrogen hydrolase, partial [Pseudomonadales bacterium]|nr:nitrilase-related carbon-nitrogen hydrolase [Pseudomonadales bacterium]
SRPGPAGQAPLRIVGGIGMSMAICYEIAYGELVRELSADAGLLATISNDTWFGDSIGPSQHLQIAQMRSVELARPLLRATNDGVTAFVDHRGRIIGRLPRFEPGALRGTVQPRAGLTPYARWGSWPVLLLMLLLLLPALLDRRRASRTQT